MGIKAFRRSPSAYYVVGQSLADVNVLLIVLLQIIPSTSVSASSVTCLLTYRNIRLVSHIRQQPNRTRMSTWEQQMTRMMLTQTLLKRP
ncbi:unnamed protein product [Rotaria sordida]|uniref:Uncharacterized protein n=1 Tax=Rotaria sordida TaxID=392033 RepID=A0A814T4F2_9BILA|nr:unnamed protein product [Rotaria sordida]CAF3785036.1 unnamed protein product [Rotaria sordida]